MTDGTESTNPGILSVQNSFSNRIHRRHSDPQMPDLLGNLPLHHAFAHTPDVVKIRELLHEYPYGARFQNQFGRVPLHYAVDRSKVNIEAVRLLLEYHPHGASLCAVDDMTPYDLAIKWGHSTELLKMLLLADPTQDPRGLQLLQFGFLAKLYIWFSSRTARHVAIGTLGERDNRRYNSGRCGSVLEEDGIAADGEVDDEVDDDNMNTSTNPSNHNSNQDDTPLTPAMYQEQGTLHASASKSRSIDGDDSNILGKIPDITSSASVLGDNSLLDPPLDDYSNSVESMMYLLYIY